MADPFFGEIRAFAFSFAPADWAMCNGQSLPQMQNQVLYSIIGKQFGGDASNFKLPDLQGRAATHAGANPAPGITARAFASQTGVSSVTINGAQLPAHNHNMQACPPKASPQTMDSQPKPGYVFGRVGNGPTQVVLAYSTAQTPSTVMAPAILSTVGQGGAHENRQPYLPLNFCICLQGAMYPIKQS